MQRKDHGKETDETKKGDKYGLRQVLGRMIRVMWQRDRGIFGEIFIYTLTAGIYPFFAVLLPKLAIGILEQGGTGAGGKLAAAMGMYALTAGLTGWLMVYLQNSINMRCMRVRLGYLSDMSHKLLTMDYKYTEDARFYKKYQKAMSAGNNNTNGVEGIYVKLYQIPAQVFNILGMIFMVGYLNPLIVVCLVLHVLVTMWVAKQNYKNTYAHKEETSEADRKIDYFYHTTHDFSYGKDIRIYHLQDRIMKNYDAEISTLQGIWRNIRNREYLFGFCSLFTLLLTNAVMYGILIWQAFHGMEISSFIMYVAATDSLLTALLTFGEFLTFVADEGQYVADYFRLMDTKLVTEGGSAEKPSGTLEIRFEHMSFRYPGTDTNVFTDLNFTIHKGERLAIVGVNGAGKSTLVKLMTGLYEPTEGQIYINDREIRQYRKKELFEMFSAVFQEVNILAFTIQENVTCHAGNVDEERLQAALEKVGLWEKVKGFPKGTEQMMLKVIDEEGTDFSGGERQKLAIARGLYKDANMVIMDEPTAALDALAEAEIYENFSTLIQGKTAVYISHRLASTKFCDKIALFDKDGLKEYGSHDELMAQKGQYYEMFTIQGKYYQERQAV